MPIIFTKTDTNKIIMNKHRKRARWLYEQSSVAQRMQPQEALFNILIKKAESF